MPIKDLYSKRQRRLQGEVPDVYIYDIIPNELRVQIVHIWGDAIGTPRQLPEDWPTIGYASIVKNLRREYGVFVLPPTFNADGHPYRELSDFLLHATTERFLDAIEASFQFIIDFASDDAYKYHAETKMTPEEAVSELNERFKEAGVGYQFENNVIVKQNSKLLHAEVIKPALSLLTNHSFKVANDEFMSAHTHYRHGKYAECLVDCLKAFESTMKIICAKRKWKHDPTAPAAKLIEIVLTNGLVPSFLQTQFQSLKAVLESGVPTVRNKLGGHGAGTKSAQIPEYLATFCIYQTASLINLLVEADKASP